MTFEGVRRNKNKNLKRLCFALNLHSESFTFNFE